LVDRQCSCSRSASRREVAPSSTTETGAPFREKATAEAVGRLLR
jgi:hypothetical protein